MNTLPNRVFVRKTSVSLVVKPEIARMLHRIQQLRNEDPNVSITISSTPEASLMLEANGMQEIITRRRAANGQ